MDSEIKNLKLEIEVLKKRVAYLEGIERRRKIVAIIKVMGIIIVSGIIIYFAYSFYDKISEMYSKVVDFSNNPLKSLF